jgi:hypothetical protein
LDAALRFSTLVANRTRTVASTVSRNPAEAKARAHGTKLAEEVRRAVDAYLAGMSPEELRLLDEGSRRAALHLDEMSRELDRDDALSELSSRRTISGRRR